jgi:hypothetical protein
MSPTRTLPKLITAFALMFVASCGEQAEGERCERSNDDNDCGPGLVCTSLQNLTGATEGAVCCPERGTASSTAICHPQTVDLDTGDEPEPQAPPQPAAEDAGG